MSQNAVFDLGNGAGKEVIFKTLNELAKQFHVELIAPGYDPQIKNCRFHHLPGNLFNKLKSIPIIGFLYNFLHLIQLKWIIKETIINKSLNPDLVYLAGPWMSNIGHTIYENKIPIVVRYYGVNWVPEKHHLIRQKIKFYLKNKGYKKFGDLVIMTDDGTRGDEFLDHMNCPQNKRIFLPNGIDFKQSSIKKVEAYNKVFEKMRTDRKKATQKEGEFSVDNLVFKVLRNKGGFDIIKNNKKEIVNNLFSMKTN
jgi:hypothetical protein